MHTIDQEVWPKWPVTVLNPCDCRYCSQGMRWFYCVDTRPAVAMYEIEAEIQPQEDWEEIKWIREQHPGMTLIY